MNRKRILHIITCSLIVGILIFFFAFVFGRSTGIETDLSEYGKWSEGTVSLLCTNSFRGSLPSENTVEQYGTSLYYQYEHYFSDNDPDFDNFVILVTLEFPEDVFETRRADLRENAAMVVSTEEEDYFFMNGKGGASNVGLYLDDKIPGDEGTVLDGMFYNFEIVRTSSHGEISYLSAHIWDPVYDDVLIDFLKQIPLR